MDSHQEAVPWKATLYSASQRGERRRVYTRMRGRSLEVGETTWGPLTRDVYDAEEHHHCIHLAPDTFAVLGTHLTVASADVGDALGRHMVENEMFLTDLMDELDGWNVPYGYLSSTLGDCVSYRPARMLRQGAGGTHVSPGT